MPKIDQITTMEMVQKARRLAERFESLSRADQNHALTPDELADFSIVLRWLSQEQTMTGA